MSLCSESFISTAPGICTGMEVILKPEIESASFADFLDAVISEENDSDIDNVVTSDEDTDDDILCEQLETSFPSSVGTPKYNVNDNTVYEKVRDFVCSETGHIDFPPKRELETLKESQAEENDNEFDTGDINVKTEIIEGVGKVSKHTSTNCNKSYASVKSLRPHSKKHTEAIHEKDPMSKKQVNECGICKRVFKRKENLTEHMFIHTDERPYECDICAQRFRQRNTLRKHKASDHAADDELYKCTECDKSFALLSRFTDHMNFHNGVRFPCTVCDKSFSAKQTLKMHMKLHSSSNREMVYFTCNICDKPFTSQSNLDLHMKVHDGTQTLVCNYCDSRFSRKSDLQRHVYIHTGEKPHKCSLCPKAFRQPGELGRHIAWHMGDNTCKYCGRRYARKDEYLRHVYNHEQQAQSITSTSDESLQCKSCKKFFQNQVNLTLHLKTHGTSRPMLYTCGTCGKAFTRNSNYHRHIREKHETHADKPAGKHKEDVEQESFFCDLCSKAFKSIRTLKEHVTYMHLKEATHKCDTCDKTYYKKSMLKKHKCKNKKITLND